MKAKYGKEHSRQIFCLVRFDCMEFENLPSLLGALSLDEESLVNKIPMDTPDQAQDKDKDAHSFDGARNWDSHKPSKQTA